MKWRVCEKGISSLTIPLLANRWMPSNVGIQQFLLAKHHLNVALVVGLASDSPET